MTAQSERAVQNALKSLRLAGLITMEMGGGRNRTTRYRVNVETVQNATDCTVSERVQVTTEKVQIETQRVQVTAETPSLSAPKETMKKQRRTTGRTNSAFAPLSELPEFLPEEPWRDFERHRVRMHPKVGWTPEACKGVVAKCQRAHDDGFDVGALLQEATGAGWRTIFPKQDSPKRKGVRVYLQQGENNGAYQRNGFGGKGAQNVAAAEDFLRDHYETAYGIGDGTAGDSGQADVRGLLPGFGRLPS